MCLPRLPRYPPAFLFLWSVFTSLDIRLEPLAVAVIRASADDAGKLQPPALKQLLAHMAAEGNAAADPPKQTTTYLLYWRKPEEWGQLIYDWVRYTGSRLEPESCRSAGTTARSRLCVLPCTRNER